ncbi:MAG: type II toxin-antitoxin system HicA family toxin [Deltaproteobacteria bacterium]|nr:type II toxin-antitoxin system HicA family toxin [Deltaproteobacteria bacterium]
MPTVAELVRLLTEAGFQLREHRKRHDLYEDATGRRIMIPRHWKQEMGTGLFHKILRDAGLKP